MDPRADDRARTAYYHRSEEMAWLLTDAMCATFQKFTGRPADERVREAIYYAVRFDI